MYFNVTHLMFNIDSLGSITVGWFQFLTMWAPCASKTARYKQSHNVGTLCIQGIKIFKQWRIQSKSFKNCFLLYPFIVRSLFYFVSVLFVQCDNLVLFPFLIVDRWLICLKRLKKNNLQASILRKLWPGNTIPDRISCPHASSCARL